MESRGSDVSLQTTAFVTSVCLCALTSPFCRGGNYVAVVCECTNNDIGIPSSHAPAMRKKFDVPIPMTCQTEDAIKDSGDKADVGGDEGSNALKDEVENDNTGFSIVPNSVESGGNEDREDNVRKTSADRSSESEVEDFMNVEEDVVKLGFVKAGELGNSQDVEEVKMNEEPVHVALKLLSTNVLLPRSGLCFQGGLGVRTNEVQANVSAYSTRPPGRVTFTSLQKWEYENGFPVDGVEDTRQWAREVGLDVGNNDPNAQNKRRKLASAEVTPKYIYSLGPNALSPEDEDSTWSPSEGSDDDDSENAFVSGEGKEKVEEPDNDHVEEVTASRKGKEKIE